MSSDSVRWSAGGLRHLDTPMGAAERERVYARHAAGLDGEPVAPTVYPSL